MRKLTEAMTNALQSATFDAKRVGTPYSDTDAIHTGWTMYSVNGRTLSAMVKRGLCMGDGGLTEAGMSARVEIMDAIAPLDFPQSAQPEECACSGTDNSWCPKHYPAPQFKDAEGNDTYSTPTFPAVSVSPEAWSAQGPILENVDAMPECYWGDSQPIVLVWFDAVGRVEGACANHAEEIRRNGHPFTMLPVCMHGNGSDCAECMARDAAEQAEGSVTLPATTPLMDSVASLNRLWVRIGKSSTCHISKGRGESICGRSGGQSVKMFPEYVVCKRCERIQEKDAKRARKIAYGAMRDAELDRMTYGGAPYSKAEEERDMADYAKGYDRTTDADIAILTADGFVEATPEILARELSAIAEPISQSGVTDCTECGAHIMVNDITVPSQCEDGCPEDTRTPEDMDDTLTAPLTIEAQLSVVVDGVTIDLGWHEFTLSAGQTEHDIPAMYGEKNGTWSRPGAPDWASVITVTATGACWH